MKCSYRKESMINPVENDNVISFDLHEIDFNECVIDKETGCFACKRYDSVVSGQMKRETLSSMENINGFFEKYQVGKNINVTFR